MGTVVGATLVEHDGTVRLVEGATQIPTCDGLIELAYNYGPDLVPPPLSAQRGMWRWRELLPLPDGPIRYPLAVGATPLVAPPGLRSVSGFPQLYLKDETRSPTGSNKDRATALVLEHALRDGATTVTAASTGNVAVSLAVGAASCGLRAVIFVPAGVAEGKLRLMLLAGATVFKVEEGYEAAFSLSRAAAQAFGWYDRNTGMNPMTLEAKKTVAFEVWEDLGRTMPDVVVVPAGDGTTLSAMAKGLRELVACGVADRVPRIIGVQAEGCQPLLCAWEGSAPRPGEGTIADGIAVASPANAVTAVRDVRMSGGCFVAVSDAAILGAIGALARSAGIIAEPAAAAGYAGLLAARAIGAIEPEERVVVLITGSGLKTPQYLAPSGRAYLVHADLEEISERMLP